MHVTSQASPGYVIRSVLNVDGGTPISTEMAIIVEEPLEIRINGVPFAVVMRTPGCERELALGFCLTEGIVNSLSEVQSLGFCPDAEDNMENIINVLIAPAAEERLRSAHSTTPNTKFESPRNLVARSSCGVCGVRMIEDLKRELSPIPNGVTFPIDRIIELQYSMSEKQTLSRLTTAAHAVSLAGITGDPIVVREDAGRHNALDKAIGYMMLNDIDCGSCAAVLSGRISYEMVQKAIRARIPVIVGVSAPTSLAIDLGLRMNCTIVGRLRKEKMVIYTHPERIIL